MYFPFDFEYLVYILFKWCICVHNIHFNVCPVSERQYALRSATLEVQARISQRGKASWRTVTRMVCHFFQTFIKAFLSALIGRVEGRASKVLWLQFNQSVPISSWPRLRRFSSSAPQSSCLRDFALALLKPAMSHLEQPHLTPKPVAAPGHNLPYQCNLGLQLRHPF